MKGGCPARREMRGRSPGGSPQAARQSICSGSFSRIGTCSKASCMAAAPLGAGGSSTCRPGAEQARTPRRRNSSSPTGPRHPALPSSPRRRFRAEAPPACPPRPGRVRGREGVVLRRGRAPSPWAAPSGR